MPILSPGKRCLLIESVTPNFGTTFGVSNISTFSIQSALQSQHQIQNMFGSAFPAEHILDDLLDRNHRVRGMGAQHAVNFCHPSKPILGPGFPQPLGPGLAAL